MSNQIFVFIIVLRALAALIITNSHYNHIYPTEIIANGGLLGDVLFFAVSGFCLANVPQNFRKWFCRRLYRIYCPVLIITAVYLLMGFYSVNSSMDFVKLFCWPTYYHFVGSIILLYIPFYFICRNHISQNKYIITSILLLVAQSIIYFTVYDKSYYHIDNVREPMIWFLFLQSMLLGAYFRGKCTTCRGGGYLFVPLILFFELYFISKILLVKYPCLSEYQIVNQAILWLVLYCFFRLFMAFENSFKNLPPKVMSAIKFLADHTLEIYLVQYVIIDKMNYGPFPVNWIIVTSTIIISAALLRFISQFGLKFFSKYV